MKSVLTIAAVALSITIMSCGNPSEPEAVKSVEPYILSGGDMTVFDNTSVAFATPAPNLTPLALEKHLSGDAQFEAAFVSAPAKLNTGLGPVFNNVSCVACHPSDGRGSPEFSSSRAQSMFLRISIPGTGPNGGPKDVPGFGTQLFDKAIFGIDPMGQMQVSYRDSLVVYPDGSETTLRIPTYSIENSYIPLPAGVLLSPRVAPPVFGRGLLEAITDDAILAQSDPADSDKDGISGRVNYVWDFVTGQKEIGRFGWKGENPSVFQQTSGAYRGDMGVTNPLFPQESSLATTLYDSLQDDPEVSAEIVDDVVFYIQTLAVPARRNTELPEVVMGEFLFGEIGCAKCHTPRFTTGIHPDERVDAASDQDIAPYTDLLLHDMGKGLADGRPVFDADGSEWKTPALWGIGLTHVVHGHTFLLHDGRARNLEEAIIWHGGESQESTDAYMALRKADREAVIAFLMSL